MENLESTIMQYVSVDNRITNRQLKRLVLTAHYGVSNNAVHTLPLFRAANELCELGLLTQTVEGYEVLAQ